MGRAAVLEGSQWGVEVTPGTVVAANKRLYNLGVNLRPVVPSRTIQPVGNIFPSDVQNGKAYCTGRMNGPLSYTDPVYPFSSLFCTPVITTPASNGIHTFTITGGPTGGTWQATYKAIQSGTIAHNAAASVVQTALEAVSTIGVGNVTVTGSAGGPYTVTLLKSLKFDPALFTLQNTFTGGSTPTITPTTTAASATRRWVWKPGQAAPNACKSFTLEQGPAGVSNGGSRAGFGMVTGTTVTWNETEVDMEGEVFAQGFEDSFTLTSATDVLQQVTNATECSCYIGDTLLGMAKLTRMQEGRFSVSDRHAMVNSVDRDAVSFIDTVEKAGQIGWTITLENETVAQALYTKLKAGTKQFMRFEALGASIESGFNYYWTITSPVKLRDPDRQARNDIWVAAYDLTGIYDSSFGAAVEVVLQTTLTAL